MLAALNQVSVLDLSWSMRPVFGQMVNVGFGPAGILGLCLAGAGAGLYLLRSTRPELARDYDIFFSAIALLCGGILFFNGWRLDPILMFGQVLMAGSAVFFAFESIRLRSITTDQARRGGGGSRPIVDDERSYDVDRVYRAELDEIEPFMEDRPPMRRIRGSRDSEAADRAAYNSNYNGSESGYSNDSYGGSDSGYSSRSSRSPRRSSRSSRRDSSGAAAYGSDTAYGSDGYRSDSYGGSESSYDSRSSDWGSSYGESDSSRRSTSRDDSSSSARRSSSRRRGASSSSSRNPYDDEATTSRSSRRSRYDASRSDSPSRSSTNDDYVDYKPISNYSEERSSSSYGSRRPASDYDDEWGS